MWRRAIINSGAGTVAIAPASAGGAAIARATLAMVANGTIDFQDGAYASLNGGPLTINAGFPLDIGMVDDDDVPVFVTGSTPTDQSFANPFPFPGAALDYDFQNGRYSPSLGLTVTRASVGYIDDLSGNWTQVAANTARISNKGLLVEEARTNSIRNNSAQGAVVGTPGTLPTNWSFMGGLPAGITSKVVAVGTLNGIDYIDINLSGTSTDVTKQIVLAPDGLNTIAAASGQTWTGSMFLQAVVADPQLPNFILTISGTNGATATESYSSPNTPVFSSLTRLSVVGPLANAGTTNVQLRLATTGVQNGWTINHTIRIGWPQLEQGAFVTSPIRTTAAAVTRNADVITVTAPPTFGSAYTLFAVGTPNAPNSYALLQAILGVDDGTVNNRTHISKNSINAQAGNIIVVGGVQQANPAFIVGWNQGILSKQAMALSPADQAMSFNGLPVTTSAVSPLFIPSTITIGSRQGGALLWDGYITRAAVWNNQRLPNSELQQLTSPAPVIIPTNGLNLAITGGPCTGFVDYSLLGGD